jgi:hypothetical protein
MYKTIWYITDETDNTKTSLVYYHFGEKPQFPSWYMKEDHVYTIEMNWNLKLVITPALFFHCLFHHYKII